MRKVVMTFGIAALVAALGSVGYAQTTKSAKPAKTSTSAPKEASATGKIVGFDDASKTLTISTSKGEEKFVLGSTVQLHEGSKTITSANLSGFTGHRPRSVIRSGQRQDCRLRHGVRTGTLGQEEVTAPGCACAGGWPLLHRSPVCTGLRSRPDLYTLPSR